MGRTSRVPLTGGAYEARSVIANAQRCLNLYPEVNPQATDPPVPVTHYPTPGLSVVATPQVGVVRGMYRATNGLLFVVVGNRVYMINSVYAVTSVGTINGGTTPVSMADNGQIMVIVDGSLASFGDAGWWVDIFSYSAVNVISDAAFYGATRVVFLDTFFVFNRPFTNQFYLSPSSWDGVSAFDPLYIASKAGGPDAIESIAVINGNLWLVGGITTEVWYNAGGEDFPFARQPGVFIQHGMEPGWSLIEADVEVFFLGKDQQGQRVVFMGKDYNALRISNHALEKELQSYAVVNDAIGFTYQQEGHTFYVLTFPSADRTWVYDLATQQWHERAYTGGGGEARHRANCCAAAYGKIFCGDHTNGRIYLWDLDTYTDAGASITRRRGFPHLPQNGKRRTFDQLQLDMEVGDNGANDTESLFVRWSDTRGASWMQPITLDLAFGTTASFYQSPSIRNLGMARDMVFEVYWSFDKKTALQGAWVTTTEAET